MKTTEPKRESRIMAAKAAMDQLEALGAERFNIGVKRVDGTMLLREAWGVRQALKSLPWRLRENLQCGHIHVRPAGCHRLSLVDDLIANAIARMKARGFEPAAVGETSPANFQAWLKHGQTLEAATSTRAAKTLAARFGGDVGSADWCHFGRLVEASGRVYSRASAFIAEVRAAMSDVAMGEAVARNGAGQGAPAMPPLRPLEEFHRDPRYGGDLHRADLAWARHAAGMGLSVVEIRRTIMQARDLSKKGDVKRQREYAERTADKAVRQAE